MARTSNLRRGRALIVALATISCGRAAEPRERTSELDDAAVATWIDSAIYARQTHGADFYARNVVDDWSEGTSDGVFRTKAMMLRQLRDSSRAGPMKECHSNMILRGYGRTVVVTYTRTTSSHRDRECSETTSIRTDTFVKINGRWMQIASHSSSASREPTMDAFGAATHSALPRDRRTRCDRAVGARRARRRTYWGHQLLRDASGGGLDGRHAQRCISDEAGADQCTSSPREWVHAEELDLERGGSRVR